MDKVLDAAVDILELLLGAVLIAFRPSEDE